MLRKPIRSPHSDKNKIAVRFVPRAFGSTTDVLSCRCLGSESWGSPLNPSTCRIPPAPTKWPAMSESAATEQRDSMSQAKKFNHGPVIEEREAARYQALSVGTRCPSRTKLSLSSPSSGQLDCQKYRRSVRHHADSGRFIRFASAGQRGLERRAPPIPVRVQYPALTSL